MLLGVTSGLLLGAVLMVLIVHPGIDLLRRLIGRDRCFDSDSLNGCSTWGNGTLLCGGIVLMTWHYLEWRSLLYVPLVPVAATLFWTAAFSFRAALVRKREFTIRNGAIFHKDGTELHPEFVIRGGSFEQTGPATGYTAAAIQLGRGEEILATNVYIDADLAQETLAKVIETAGPRGCRFVDVCFVARIDPTTWHVVEFNAPWTPLLCGQLEYLSDSDRAWWRQWCQPPFGGLGRADVDSNTIAGKLDHLVETYPYIVDAHPEDGADHDRTPTLNLLTGNVRLRDNVRALRSLLARHPSVEIVTSRAHRADVESVYKQRGGGIEHSFADDGIEVQCVRRLK
jgi:hypothetical protein